MIDNCDVCCGSGMPLSGKPCICGGTGRMVEAVAGLRSELQRAHKEADDAVALLDDVFAHLAEKTRWFGAGNSEAKGALDMLARFDILELRYQAITKRRQR